MNRTHPLTPAAARLHARATITRRAGDPRTEARFLPMQPPSTWAKVRAALARAKWEDALIVLGFGASFAMAVLMLVLAS